MYTQPSRQLFVLLRRQISWLRYLVTMVFTIAITASLSDVMAPTPRDVDGELREKDVMISKHEGTFADHGDDHVTSVAHEHWHHSHPLPPCS